MATTDIGNVANSTSTQNQNGTEGTIQSGSSNATTTSNANATGQQASQNVYQPWQTALQAQAGGAASNYLTTGQAPSGVTGAPPQLVSAFTDQFNQNVAPQLAAQYGAGSPAIASQLALGLEQLNANTYSTNLNAYQNTLSQAGNLGFNAVGQTGTSGQQQNSTSNTNETWQQALADTYNMSSTATSFANQLPVSAGNGSITSSISANSPFS